MIFFVCSSLFPAKRPILIYDGKYFVGDNGHSTARGVFARPEYRYCRFVCSLCFNKGN